MLPWQTVRVQLDIESLRTFLTVLDWGSMTRAAEQLGLTQSAVSWKLKRLEQRVGRPLLIRDGRDLRPSREGRLLLEEARAIVEAHDRIVYRLGSPDFTGTIKVGSNEEVGAARLAGILGRFKRLHPAATIELFIHQSRVLRPMLERGKLDVAVVQVTEDEVEATDAVLWSEQLVWAAHRDTPYDEGVVPLISYGESGFYRPVTEPILDRHGIEYRYTVTAPSSANVRAAVEAGLGVAVLSERFLDDEVVEWSRASDLDPLPRSCQVVRTVPGETSAIAGEVAAAIAEEFVDLPARSDWDE